MPPGPPRDDVCQSVQDGTALVVLHDICAPRGTPVLPSGILPACIDGAREVGWILGTATYPRPTPGRSGP
jgi:hypothetical protein